MNNSILRFSTFICLFVIFVVGISCNKNETDVFKNDVRVKSGIKITGSEQVPGRAISDRDDSLSGRSCD